MQVSINYNGLVNLVGSTKNPLNTVHNLILSFGVRSGDSKASYVYYVPKDLFNSDNVTIKRNRTFVGQDIQSLEFKNAEGIIRIAREDDTWMLPTQQHHHVCVLCGTIPPERKLHLWGDDWVNHKAWGWVSKNELIMEQKDYVQLYSESPIVPYFTPFDKLVTPIENVINHPKVRGLLKDILNDAGIKLFLSALKSGGGFAINSLNVSIYDIGKLWESYGFRKTESNTRGFYIRYQDGSTELMDADSFLDSKFVECRKDEGEVDSVVFKMPPLFNFIPGMKLKEDIDLIVEVSVPHYTDDMIFFNVYLTGDNGLDIAKGLWEDDFSDVNIANFEFPNGQMVHDINERRDLYIKLIDDVIKESSNADAKNFIVHVNGKPLFLIANYPELDLTTDYRILHLDSEFNPNVELSVCYGGPF